MACTRMRDVTPSSGHRVAAWIARRETSSPSCHRHDRRSPGIQSPEGHRRRASRAGANLRRPLVPVLLRWTRGAEPRPQWRRIPRKERRRITRNVMLVCMYASRLATGTTGGLSPARALASGPHDAGLQRGGIYHRRKPTMAPTSRPEGGGAARTWGPA